MGKDQGKDDKTDILMGICQRLPSHDGEADEIFYKQLKDVSQSCSCGGLRLGTCLLEIQRSEKETVEEVPGVCGEQLPHTTGV